MDKTIVITLGGRPDQYRLESAAYDRLAAYLDRAETRLGDDPDRGEVVGDLERSVGDRLSVLLASGDRVVTASDMDGVLAEIGAVDSGQGPVTGQADKPRPKRRLERIRKGQMLTGVCNGLAAYAQVRVDWVRSGFVIGSLATGGILGLVYIALIFIMPVADPDES